MILIRNQIRFESRALRENEVVIRNSPRQHDSYGWIVELFRYNVGPGSPKEVTYQIVDPKTGRIYAEGTTKIRFGTVMSDLVTRYKGCDQTIVHPSTRDLLVNDKSLPDYLAAQCNL